MNKPVAWMLKDNKWNDVCRYSSYPTEGAIPLYTHPVKELTDEEITNTWEECGDSDIAKDMQVKSFIKYFAKAILRKAQEK